MTETPSPPSPRHRRRHSRFAALLVFLLPACAGPGSELARPQVDTLPGGLLKVFSPRPTRWVDSSGWRVVEDLRITGEEGTPGELINPQSLAVDGADRIYVVDQKPAVIKVYDRDGRFLRSIGREGAGPGEFRAGFVAVHGAFLVLHDPRVARTTVFDTSGAFLRSWASSCCYWTQIAADTAGRVYIPSMTSEGSPGTPYVRYRLDGTAADTVWVPRSAEGKNWVIRSGQGRNQSIAMTSVPLSPQIVSALHPEGGLVLGWSGGYELVRSGTGRDTLLLFGRAWTADPVSADRKQAMVDSMVKAWDWVDPKLARAAFHAGDIPSTTPAFAGISVDEGGNVWVRTGPDAAGRLRYDVFDRAGAWLGPVWFPFIFERWGGASFGRDAVVVATEGPDGRPAAVRFRIVKGEEP